LLNAVVGLQVFQNPFNLDSTTEEVMREIIGEKFKLNTVISVAYRLDAIKRQIKSWSSSKDRYSRWAGPMTYCRHFGMELWIGVDIAVLSTIS
jgi:hypothetical protein